MTYEDYLIHSSELRHFSFFKKKPKYYKKDGNRYYYSKAEWDAHLRNQQARQSNVDRTRADISSRRTKYGKPRETSDTARLAARRERAARISKAKEDIAKQQAAYRKASGKDIRADRERLKRDLATNTSSKNKHLLRAEYKIKLLSSKWNKKFSEIKSSVSGKINQGKKVAGKLITDLSKNISSSFTSFRKNFSDAIEKGKKYVSDVRALKNTEDLYAERQRIADARWEDVKTASKELAERVDRVGYGVRHDEELDNLDRAHKERRAAKDAAEFMWERFQDRARQKNQSKEEFINSVLKVLGL